MYVPLPAYQKPQQPWHTATARRIDAIILARVLKWLESPLRTRRWDAAPDHDPDDCFVMVVGATQPID
jgi:hypothetical protein